jgi:NAD(P)-dependent dehydrogenase (short-subunit alcohol dehydrogenase family)
MTDKPTSQPLSGQVALVTGASRGIGRAIALELGRLGAAVAVVARTVAARDDLPGTVGATVAEITDAGGRAIALAADLFDRTQLARLVDETRQQLGGLDILVNNAANTGSPVFESIWTQTPESWRATMELNVNVPWELTKLAAPGMRDAGGGIVINVSSTSGLLLDQPLPAPGEAGWLGAVYGASKAAMNQMSWYLGNELRAEGITVVAFDPEFTRTEATELFAATYGIDLSLAHPMADVAAACCRLVTSPDRASYTGRFLNFTTMSKIGGE